MKKIALLFVVLSQVGCCKVCGISACDASQFVLSNAWAAVRAAFSCNVCG